MSLRCLAIIRPSPRDVQVNIGPTAAAAGDVIWTCSLWWWCVGCVGGGGDGGGGGHPPPNGGG